MPKASPNQTTFSGGEYSPLVQGRVDAEAYKKGLATCLNYIPTLQGPLVRRPGTKYIANVKDPSNPPTLIPFQFSQSQSYVLEFGNNYCRFFANEGQIVVNTTVIQVHGIMGFNQGLFTALTFDATRDNSNPITPDEGITSSSVIAAGQPLELVTPFSVGEVPNLRYAQSGDTLYITHSSHMLYKLQRFSQTNWTLKPVILQDGPFLPVNSYKTTGDSTRITLIPSAPGIGLLQTGPNFNVFNATNNGAGQVRITTGSSNTFANGDQVVVVGVPGTTEANNGTSTIAASFWTIKVVAANQFDLVGSTFSNACTGSSGIVSPALFRMSADGGVFGDAQPGKLRTFSLIQGGVRFWGIITGVQTPAKASFVAYTIFSSAVETTAWQMGTFSAANGFPSTVCFHQDRLALAGAPQFPQQIDLSMTSLYENFAIAGSSLQVADNNAVSLRLLSTESNPIRWVKSSAQGLLAGSGACEWQIAPDNQQAAITPTNRNAIATSFFGSAPVDAVQAGNATLYVQSAFRKLREMNYFFQVGTFRSTDLSELSEHITIPGITKLAVQKEPLPLVWALRSDGGLLSMAYNRDDQTIKAGWSRHQLGGFSDTGGSPPVIKSLAVISASSATFDQLWTTVQRSINGTSVVTVEVVTPVWNAGMAQADGYCLDCGATYDSPAAIIAISTSGSTRVLSVGHGLSDGDQLRISDVIGMNVSTTDIDGNISNANTLNDKTFVASNTTIGGFNLKDLSGNYVNTGSSSVYVSGGRVRKFISTISGLTWLKNETVSLVTDGGIHPTAVVNSAGVLALSWAATKVQIGYAYNSDGSTLRSDAGGATGSSIGMTRRITRAAFLLYSCGDFSFGPNFNRLLPCEFPRADQQQADQPTPLFTGLTRDGVESIYDLDDALSFRQNSGLPGMVQSVTVMLEETDV